MTDIKVGDRVKVEFEATAYYVSNSLTYIDLRDDDGELYEEVPTRVVTKDYPTIAFPRGNGIKSNTSS